MAEERKRILGMAASGKISVAEAEELLNALDGRRHELIPAAAPKKTTGSTKEMPKFFRVTVDSTGGDNVDVRIPFSLIKAGIRLKTLMPPEVAQKVNNHLSKSGIDVDLNLLDKEDIEDFVASFAGMKVNVDAASGDKVRVFCE